LDRDNQKDKDKCKKKKSAKGCNKGDASGKGKPYGSLRHNHLPRSAAYLRSKHLIRLFEFKTWRENYIIVGLMLILSLIGRLKAVVGISQAQAFAGICRGFAEKGFGTP
jgi:hypothetical protein